MKRFRLSWSRLAWGAGFAVFAGLASSQSLTPTAHEHAKKQAAQRRPPPLAIDASFGPDGRLWVVALDERRRLTLLQSRDEGRTWNPPRTLDTGDDRVAATGENRPHLVFGPQGRVVIVYAFEYAPQANVKRHAGEIRALHSADGGNTFSPPVTIHHDRQAIAHSFPATMFDAQGALHSFWIDKRDAEATPAGTRYAGSAVYRNVSTDGGRTFAADTKLADNACECCRIALAPDGKGGIAAMWRHVFEGNVRDHAFARVASAATTPTVRASFDEWKIEACPHHGPGLAPAQEEGYHAVWFGERSGRSAVRYGRLSASGEPQGPVRELPDEAAEHADVLSAGKSVVIVWRSYDGTATSLRALVSDDDGKSFTPRQLATTREDNDYGKLARKGDRIFVVWRTANEIKVERVTP